MRSPTQLNTAGFFERAHKSFAEKHPFVLYCKPGSSATIGVFQEDGKSHRLSGFDDEGYVFAPFSGSDIPFIPFAHSQVCILGEEIAGNDLIADIGKEALPAIDPKYRALIELATAAIHQQRFEKVVLSRKETVSLKEADFVKIYKRLATAYPDSYTYCWYQPETGLWLGAFKEQLAKVTDGSLETMALAGTKPWTEEKTDWGSKELAEQKYVTTFIVDRIAGLTHNIITGPLATVRAGAVVHLRTDIHACLSPGTHLRQIVEALHPTPAVCGLPREESMSFILQHEGYDRAFYSGYHGEMNRDVVTGEAQSDLYVNLRCMNLVPDGIGGAVAHVYVGGGITGDSDPQDEWLETVNKATTMKKVLFN